MTAPPEQPAPAPRATPKPTPQQQAAIAARTVSVVLSAGAGCGKTSVLTQRFLSHLAPGPEACELPRLVAITFTERAAREMRERIRGQCLAKLRAAPTDEAQHWLRIVRELDAARISTIHSFCSSLLRSYAVEAGLDPGFGLLDETLADSFLRQAVRDALHELLAARDPDAEELVFEYGLSRTQDLLATLVLERYRLDPAQWQFTARQLAQRWDERWYTVAVPRLLREAAESEPATRTLKLLRENVSRNAVMQMRCAALLEQIPRLADPSLADPAFAAGGELEAVLDAIAENARVQGGGTKKDWDDQEAYEAIKDAFTDLRDLVSKVHGQLDYDPEHLLRGAEIGLCGLRAAAKVGAVYDQRKAEAGVVDFDDLLLRARNLLRDFDDVRRRTADGISLLMVDEFQDTDPIQDEIVRMLCGAALLEGRLFVVGDAKQSIYRFRRAEPRVFHKLRQKVPPAGRLPLSVNFRSQPQILAFVNAVFDGALGAEYEALEASEPQLSTEPCVEFLFSVPAADEAAADDENDRSVAARRRREADWIARRITQLLGDGASRVRYRDTQSGEFKLRPAAQRDIVILFRAMSDVRYYEEALRDYRLDYYVVGGRAFFAQQEIFDLVNLCQYLDNVDDEAALVGILRSPFFSLSDDALFALGPSPTRGLALAPPPHLAEEQQRRIRFAARVLGELRDKKDRLPIARLLTLAIDRTGYDAALLTEFLGVRKLANLRKLIDMARQFDQSGLFTLADFVDRLREAVSEETHEALAATHPESADVIRLMSIHQSKGLEFPIVIVADMDRKGRDQPPAAHFDAQLGPLLTLPEKFGERRDHLGIRMFRLDERDEALAESLRLFYVAATRAADLLILSAGLLHAGRPVNPWMKLLAERFDLLNGQPRQAPASGGVSILAKYSGRLPEILIHQAPPRPIARSSDAAPRPPALTRFRELLDSALPDPLPETLRIVPPDPSARRRFSVSEIEAVDALIRSHESGASRRVEFETTFRSDPGDHGAAPFAGLSVAEQLGTLVHAAFERLDFRAPQDVAALVDVCCAAAPGICDEAARTAAAACVANVLASPLGAELAAARQMHREIDFLLAFPAPDASVTISGTIDCLFESADGKWTIIDYKTGIRDGKIPAAELLAEYEIQLGLYALAARELLKRLPDRIELVFVRQRVDRVAFEPHLDRLSQITARVARALSR